jgi:hypothetical protein
VKTRLVSHRLIFFSKLFGAFWDLKGAYSKCEIFDILDSRYFYTIKLPKVGDFGIVIKNMKLFRFVHDLIFPRKY